MAKKVMYDEMINAKKAAKGSTPSLKAADALLGMENSMKGAKSGGGFPVGHEPSVGHGQFANLPQDVKMDLYPKPRKDLDGLLDDSMSDLDRISNDSESQRGKYMSYQK